MIEDKVAIEQRLAALHKIIEVMNPLSKEQQMILWKTLAIMLEIEG